MNLPGPKVIKLFQCSTQLSTKFILLTNVKMPTIVGILTFISMINTTFERLKAKIKCSVELSMIFFYNLGTMIKCLRTLTKALTGMECRCRVDCKFVKASS